MSVYRSWEGYQTSLVHAIAPITGEQAAFRPAPGLRSVGEIGCHIWVGRLGWFLRMGAPGAEDLAKQVPQWVQDGHGNRYIVEEALSTEPAEVVRWLEATWQIIEATLPQWRVADLEQTYRHTYCENTYAV